MAVTADAPAPPATLLVLSAHTPTALAAQARQLAAHWPAAPLAEIAYTAAVGRAALPQRLALVAAQSADCAAGAGDLRPRRPGPAGAGRPSGRRRRGGAVAGRARRRCTAARAAHWRSTVPRFARCWTRRSQRPHPTGPPICAACCGTTTQPGTAWMCSRRWWCCRSRWDATGARSAWNPACCLGHSLGEYAAACLAGVLTLCDTLRLVCACAVVREHCARRRLASGDRKPTAPLAEPRAGSLPPGGRASLTYQRPPVALCVEPDRHLGAGRGGLGRLLVSPPARRRSASTTRCSVPAPRHRPCTWKWVPASTLAALVRSTLRDAAPCVLPGLRGDDQEWTEHLTTLGQLYVRGTPLCWSQVWGAPRRKVTLPSYPFQRQRYWFAAPPTTAASCAGRCRSALPGPVVHPLLGRRLDLAGREIIYETDLRSVDYLADHRLDGVAVFPTTGYLELALAAGREAGFGKLLDVRDLKIRRPLVLGADQSGRVQVVLTPDGSGLACRILRAAPGKWHTHATCRLEAEGEDGTARVVGRAAGGARGRWPPTTPAAGSGAWTTGRRFKVCSNSRGAAGQAWGVAVLPAQVDPHGYLVHPALLDACLQVTAAALREHPPTPGSRYASRDTASRKPTQPLDTSAGPRTSPIAGSRGPTDCRYPRHGRRGTHDGPHRRTAVAARRTQTHPAN